MFLFIFHFAESETASNIYTSFRIQNFMLYMLKTMGIEIMHTDFHIDWTDILGVFIKNVGFSFFFDHPVHRAS